MAYYSGFIIFFLLFSSTLTFGQDLARDMPFFVNKAKLYEHWLIQKGLGDVLKLEKVQLSEDQADLELILSIRSTKINDAVSMWKSLEKTFSTQNPETSLKKYLYGTFVRMMEISPEQGNIQIYIPKPAYEQPLSGETDFIPCFYVWYWGENGQIKEEVKLKGLCKGPQPFVLEMEFPELKKVGNSEEIPVPGSQEASTTVFREIEKYAHQRYDGLGYTSDTPSHIEILYEDDYRFEFTVTDIRREVLTDEKRSLWCQFVNYWWGNCDDVRRERLEFNFRYIPTSNGYILDCSLTGKFGSGVFEPRVSGYMDMEPDFLEDYLKPYVRRFGVDLKRHLETLTPTPGKKD